MGPEHECRIGLSSSGRSSMVFFLDRQQDGLGAFNPYNERYRFYRTVRIAEMSRAWNDQPNGRQPSRMPYLFRALESHNFRLFVTGQLISLVGTWMQQLAMSWLVYRLTGSPMLLGLIAFLGQVPGFFVAPVAGMLADHFDRRRILLVAQTLAMAQALALAYLAFTNQVQVWHVLYLSAFLGIVTGIDIPMRQAFVTDMLERPEDLGNAISLNSSIFNGTRLIGPAIAGFLIATVGEKWCFLMNALSYIAVIIALLSMRLKPSEQKSRPQGYLRGIGEGFAYAWHFEPIRSILLLVGLVSLVGLPYSVLMPIYAREILHGGPQTLGFLMGSAGAGALTGAMFLASRANILGLGRLIPVATMVFGLGLMAFAHSSMLWLSMPLMFLVGLGMMLQLASSNIILQTMAEEDKRGRVLSLYTMSFLGLTPLGSLVIGTLASHIGVAVTLTIGGALCILAGLYFSTRLSRLQELARPVAVSKRVLPEREVAPMRQ
jgi:MFS family permease